MTTEFGAVSIKAEHLQIYNTNSIPVYIYPTATCTYVQQKIYKRLFIAALLLIEKKWEKSEMFIKHSMDKMICLYNGIPDSNKNEKNHNHIKKHELIL